MNILLTTSAPPSQTPFSTTEKRPPIGMGFLISVLRDAGHNIFFVDNYLHPSDFLETDYLQRHQIDFVGIYTNTICYRDSLRMFYRLEEMRQKGHWQGKIVAGGPHASVSPETIPSFVDHIVIGEGEYALRDIVAGKVAERIVKYPPITDLDELPMPAWDYFAEIPYNWGGNWLPEAPVFTMNTSRGCPFDCTFCSVGSIWGRRYTYFSAARIVADIEHVIKHHGAKGIYFREDNFTLNKKRLYEFCNLMIAKNLNIPWVCETRASSLDRETVELMARAGAKGAYIGVESGSQRLLDFMHKSIKIEDVHNAFQLCHEFGIKTAASIIVGVPTETEQERQMTVSLLAAIKPTVTWYNVFVGIPKSALYQYVLEHKLYEYIDDRGLVYLKGHNEQVKRWYGDAWNADIPVQLENNTILNPRISVVMSVYNGEKHLLKAIHSILNQTYNNFEFIIIDDASTDSTPAILSDIDDPRIKRFRNESNIGLTRSLNKALKHCCGEFIARMDADDFSLPHRFEKQVQFLEKSPSTAVVGSAYYMMNDEDAIVATVDVLTDPIDIHNDLVRQNWFGHGSVMMKKSCLCSVGGYDEEFIYAQDYDLFLRLSETCRLANIAEPLYFWRKSQQSISQQKAHEQNDFAMLARKRATLRRSTLTCHRSTPLVSVIVPTYNRPDLLRDAISSILSQTFRNFEIIVINDAGQDVEHVVASFNTPTIRYITHDTNKGLAAARNTGIKAAKGKYIAYLDDDDIYYANHLETLVGFLENNSGYRVAYTDACRAIQEVSGGKRVTINRDIPYSSDFDYHRILAQNFIPVLCIMHHRSCFDTVEPFDDRLKRYEDWDMWVRMSRYFSFAHIKSTTCEFSTRTDKSGMLQGRREPFNWAILHMLHKYRPYICKLPKIRALHRRMVQVALDRIIYSLTNLSVADSIGVPGLLCIESSEQVLCEAKYLMSRYPEERQRFEKLFHLLDSVINNFYNKPEEAPHKSIKSLGFGQTISIKCCTPNRTEIGWGDTLFADALARAFEQLGYKCRVDFKDEWYTRLETDIVIHLKGLFRYNPNPSTTNIIWIISHPELITKEELDDYDLVFCASESFTHKIKDACHASVHYLPQAGIPDVFRSDSNKTKDIDLLFVGNNRYSANGSGRKIVADLLAIGESYKLAVVGQRWEGYVNSENILAEYIEPSQLGNLYARTKIALNDHHEMMRLEGFINNRTFDLALSNIFQISDRVKGLEKLSIITYYSIADLKSKVDCFLTNPRAREQFASSAYDKCRLYTFEYRAKQIIELLNSCLKDEKNTNLRKKFGRAGNKIVTECFNQATEVQKLSQIFNKCSANPVFNAYTLGVQCPICNIQPREFQPLGQTPGSNAQCPECGSLECHRLLWLFLQQHTKLFATPNLKMLDVAPAQCLSARIQKIPRLHYLSIDNNSPHAMRQMDLTNLQLPDNCFDCLLCGYVPEFINDGKKVMNELVRVLKPGGWAIFRASFRNGNALNGRAVTDAAEDTGLSESPADVSTYDAEDFKARLGSQGFTANVLPFAKSLPASDIRRYGLQANEDIYFCFKA